ncbi:hypothetical protein A4A49_61566 [Nicotiana attenuata]|uniref:S-protein homolog n=1 Tax=Nicotiana attenuata TaxID=49451 RepID=A0A1J6IM88_NICAT|nr:hypothetical protein A4A49_61566 [Nicotiana attenuata]
MSYSLIKTIFIVFLLSFHLTESRFFYPKFLVSILNSLPNNDIPLTVHCQSKDNNLGYHNITIGQRYSWKFHENLKWSTLFFCHFWWYPKQTSFDVFNNGYKCIKKGPVDTQDCYWEVKSDGFSLNGVKIHDW